MIGRWNRRVGGEQPPNRAAAENGQTSFRSSPLRLGLVLARAGLLFVLCCWLVMVFGLQMRGAREQGWGLNSSADMHESSVSRFGLPFIGTTVELDSMSATERSLALERLSDHGIGWARQRFDWNTLEPKPGTYDWRSSDAIVAAFSQSDLTPIAVLDGSPAWARAPQDRPPTDNPLAPPADPAAFAHFAEAFALRYGENVRFYQLWDEPNITPHWGNQHIAPTEYAQLLIEASRAIRSVDEDAVIIAGALAPTTDRGHTAIDEVFFLQRLYAAGVQPHVDVMAIEPYGFGYSAQDPTQQQTVLNFQRAALVRRAMVAAGVGETPLLAARSGWNRSPDSPWRTVEPAAQQAYLNQSIELAWRQWPWLAGLGWTIDRPSAPAADPLWGFALDDTLLETIDAWPIATSGERSGYATTTQWALMLATIALVVVLWRTGAALRLIPWVTWRIEYLDLQPAIRILLWLLIGGLYFFATWPPLILLLLILASVLIAMQPIAGLWLAAALLPFHFQHKELHLVDLLLLIPPTQAMVLASIPSIAMRIKRNLRLTHASSLLRTLQPLDWFAVGWLGIGLLTMVNVWHWPGYRAGLLELVIVPLALYWMVRLFATDQRAQTLTAVALFAGGVLVAAIGLVDWIAGGGTDADNVRRLAGPYFSPNHAALYLERSLFLGMGIWLFWRSDSEAPATPRQKWYRSCLLASIVTVGAALLLTASRGALLLGAPFGFLLFIWLLQPGENGSIILSNIGVDRRSRYQRDKSRGPDQSVAHQNRPASSRTYGLIAVVGVSLFLVIATAFWPRLSNTATVVERVGVWQASLALWRSLPTLGAGPGGFYWRFPEHIPIGSLLDPNLRHPHNIWMESATTWGAVGLIWLLAIIAWSMRRIWLERQSLSTIRLGGIVIGLLAGLAAGVAHGQVDAFAALADIAGWNWLALGFWRTIMRER